MSSSPEKRLRGLLAARDTRTVEKYMPFMRASSSRVQPHKYIFATSTSSTHFLEFQALVRNLNKNAFRQLSSYTLVVYDLGLTATQRKLALLEKCEFLVYHDTSVRWQPSTNASQVFQPARERGMALRYAAPGSIAVRTLLPTMRYFGYHQACQLDPYGEVQGGLGVYHNEPFVRNVVLDTWVSCALTTSCMCLPGATRFLSCRNTMPRKHSVCHRFDQSALGIIVSTLYGDRTALVLQLDRSIVVKRGHPENWFKP